MQKEEQAKLKAEQEVLEAQLATSSANKKEGDTQKQATTPEQTSDGNYQTHNGFTASSMKEAIAMSESGGSYTATNGRYYGRYQLDLTYLNGDLSPENQERVFEKYINERYGGLQGAWDHWKAFGWYQKKQVNKIKNFLKVETKYNENLADAQVLVVTLLSNINRTWDFIVDTDVYHTLRLNEDYLVTTQDDWLGTIVGIRFETVANAINLKATVLKPVPDDDQVEVLDETEDECIEEDEMHEMCEKDIGPHRYLVANMEDNALKLKSQSIDDTEEDHQLDVEYKWLMEDTSYPLKAVHYLWEYKYAGKTSNVVDVRSSIHDLLVLKRFAEDKLYDLGELSDEEVDAYNKFHENKVNFPLPLRNAYDDKLRVLYKGNKDKNEK